jgi:hypothetical protein
MCSQPGLLPDFQPARFAMEILEEVRIHESPHRLVVAYSTF